MQKEIESNRQLILGELEVDLKSRQVRVNSFVIRLRRKEFDILVLLIKHPGWVYTKEQIYELIWKDEYPVDIDNTVACQMKQLRKKLGCNPQGKPYVETVWGVGYKLNYERAFLMK